MKARVLAVAAVLCLCPQGLWAGYNYWVSQDLTNSYYSPGGYYGMESGSVVLTCTGPCGAARMVIRTSGGSGSFQYGTSGGLINASATLYGDGTGQACLYAAGAYGGQSGGCASITPHDNMVVLVTAANTANGPATGLFIDGVPVIITPVSSLALASTFIGLGASSTSPDTLLGLYQGTPLTERQWSHGNALPDKVTLFQMPIEESSEDDGDVIVAIGETLIHELGHYFGLSEEEVEAIEEQYWRGEGDLDDANGGPEEPGDDSH